MGFWSGCGQLQMLCKPGVTHSPGTAIAGVSVAVNLLCLPLYRMAEAAQDRERARQRGMSRWVDHIKRTFSGDERYTMLSAYYAERGYRPAYALAGSLTLLLQIPFFMAAHSHLSGMEMLKGGLLPVPARPRLAGRAAGDQIG